MQSLCEQFEQPCSGSFAVQLIGEKLIATASKDCVIKPTGNYCVNKLFSCIFIQIFTKLANFPQCDTFQTFIYILIADPYSKVAIHINNKGLCTTGSVVCFNIFTSCKQSMANKINKIRLFCTKLKQKNIERTNRAVLEK